MEVKRKTINLDTKKRIYLKAIFYRNYIICICSFPFIRYYYYYYWVLEMAYRVQKRIGWVTVVIVSVHVHPCVWLNTIEFIKWYQNLKSLPLKNIGGWHLCALKQVRVCDSPNQMSMWNPQPGRSVWCPQPDHTLWCPQPGENLWCPQWGESVMPWSMWESDSFEQLSLWCLQPGESLWCPQSG